MFGMAEASSPTQNVDNCSEQEVSSPTALELQALWKLRAGLVSAAGQPLRAFTRVKDVYVEDSRDWATHSPGIIHWQLSRSCPSQRAQ